MEFSVRRKPSGYLNSSKEHLVKCNFCFNFKNQATEQTSNRGLASLAGGCLPDSTAPPGKGTGPGPEKAKIQLRDQLQLSAS